MLLFQGCMPYRYPACDHKSLYDVYAEGRIGKAKLEECKGQFIFDDDCPTKCTNKNYKTSIDKDRVKCELKLNLYNNGSLNLVFFVFHSEITR